MSYLSLFRCISCGREYARDEIRYLCPECSRDYKPGIPLPGVLEVLYDYDKIRQIWENLKAIYGGADHIPLTELLRLFSPVSSLHFPPLPVGNTPLFKAASLAGKYGLGQLWIKYDGLNPSGSLKDRASQLMVAEARRLGISRIVCASTGNAACSLAAQCAAAGLKAVIFAPEFAPPAKLTQIMIHKAELNKVKGTYDDAFAAALAYTDGDEVLNRNTAYHPYTIEGKKTAGLEIFHQLGVPDWIVLPTGDGVILSAIHKAFLDLKRTGIINTLPRILSVQAESSDAITSYWESGVYRDAAQPATLADSISVKTPSNAHWAVLALKESGGISLRVTDREISRSQNELASEAGVFAEPSSSATLAGLKKALAQNMIPSDAQIVLLITGHGLKDIGAVKLEHS
ncbi:MAG: threonine synthase [Candidatus Cloacimonetes bacterium]|nr:threonine synthase [Candidatus Cloacimonadota bacterium]